MKHRLRLFAAAAALACAACLPPSVAAAACAVSSAYDLTVTPDALAFDRVQGKARRIEMRAGALADRGVPVKLDRADRQRVLRIERGIRALLPRVRALGKRAVDLMAAAAREEARATSPVSAGDPQLNAKLDARAAELRKRIDASNATSEWRGNAFNRYAASALVDVVPLIAGDLGRQAFDATLKGDFSRAAALGERAAGVRASLERRVRSRLAVLQPSIDALCPAIRELDTLESGLRSRLSDGSALDLVQVRS